MRRVAAGAALVGALILVGCGRPSRPPAAIDPASARDTAGRGSTTGAVDSLRGDELAARHMADVADMLQGRVPGLAIVRLGNGDISLRIRGTDSMLNDGEPLLILDGAPVGSQNVSTVLRALNPREIDSIDVLKDVSSTSVYGTRGAHGVILITMKRHR